VLEEDRKWQAKAQIAPAMDEAKASGATALNVLSAPLFSFNRRIVIEQSAALRLAAIYEWPEMAEEGGLIGYGPRLTLIYRQLTRLIVKVFGGAEPKDLRSSSRPSSISWSI
jgi:putative tryptophan/tyrosine transport system substrate-binding protein